MSDQRSQDEETRQEAETAGPRRLPAFPPPVLSVIFRTVNFISARSVVRAWT
jgi:hypothetical protein